MKLLRLARSALARVIGRCWLRLFGWEVVGTDLVLPPKMVVASAPHTSSWDMPHTLAVAWCHRIRVHWLGKHTLFRWPLGVVMRWLGGVPVDRTSAAGFVEEAARVLRESERMTLVIAPEGTRRRTGKWKSGFYRIAMAAQVPIVLTGFDYPRKVVFFGPLIEPTGDYEKDLERIQSHFHAGMAVKPENYSGPETGPSGGKATPGVWGVEPPKNKESWEKP